jgi:hypothetical protein
MVLHRIEKLNEYVALLPEGEMAAASSSSTISKQTNGRQQKYAVGHPSAKRTTVSWR